MLIFHLIYCSSLDGTCNTQINKVVCHPTLPLIVTGHEDKYIRFFDSKSGNVIRIRRYHNSVDNYFQVKLLTL